MSHIFNNENQVQLVFVSTFVDNSTITDLKCKQVKANDTKVHCSWTAVPPSPSYELEMGDESGSSMEKKTVGKAECTFEGKGLHFNKTYSVKLGSAQKTDVVLLRMLTF